METEQPKQKSSPHVLIFPCPAQGHVNPMLKLAELIAIQNLHITFLNTKYIHNRLIQFNDDIQDLLECYPKLQFKTISDFHDDEEKHPGFGEKIGDVVVALTLYGKPLLRDVIVSEKISCLIVDGIFGDLAIDLAHEFGIQLITFRTVSACCLWAYLCVPKLIQCNELPIRGDEDMDRIIRNMPGMENLLRCRDLPSFKRLAKENEHIALDHVVFQNQQSLKANALILNTFEDLEAPILSQIRLHFPKLIIYTLGPLHHHLNTTKKTSSSSSSFFKADRTCMTWLESQPLKSVVYVNFGSITSMKGEEIIEIWHGLLNSKKQFLWVIRPNMVQEKGLLKELEEGTSKEQGLIVGWVPQEEVLSHKAIGAFLTHSGWNSTLESLVYGVPMICWPYFSDQQINSRFVSEVWKIGLDMKDVCDRKVLENMVNDVMVNRKEEFLKSAMEIAKLACKSVSCDGSSYNNFRDLIEYIRSTSP
ncbi:7-deoxyloganetic acid glucosyltransferase-like [Trifolium pratense]|uniref:7-deoxyloganetic acid glucosyltransferase-like n=1 Tax=Trifolium pratense TaxID=57577 RepID=UPI001E690E0A|nr:7-deoxyloganetic acid glucosyltransferase-like [Trifolium pratense]